ncbi:lipid-A-disaccharide synthase N-terminal domain-containing protein [Legionella oakridgensis]|uniref:Lipid A biosynthesis N-terminal domain protein n=2 Tax=Legionella oakridgensis TaxID=29423 RepID=W0BGA9_9GAMM|nr:lipid-A-disaccharide synthase N-terminal domain-containing protein [Legionella oakridgensis]AHE67657.1 lipid A biosynthesis N-terminal domain protein [Legionella oakridgensis ATCC 33761 = DSM 21215]ETO92886.1 lipid A biosynthesis N-terminal domain protein [Legionella oakridgensis RV-2-2007]KTD37007.1 lipid-A-disaccharide synthase [Legionella oakridgensis]STY20684.1 lipid-A-disaccharide synthase [Legionella longbeachae]
MNVEYIWLGIGLLGQAVFSARFIVQWLVSEKEKRSVIPVAFWYLSLLGGITLLTYSIYKRDPVFILGQSTGVFIYSRNLLLIQRERLARHEKLREA